MIGQPAFEIYEARSYLQVLLRRNSSCGFYMFSTKSNVPALNENHLLSSSAAAGPDWPEEQQQFQVQPLSDSTILDWSRVGTKTIGDFFVELADPYEAVLAEAENSKEETSNTGNQLSSDAVVDWNRVEDTTIDNFFVVLEDPPEDVPADAENNNEETSSAGKQSEPAAARSFERHATEYTGNIDDQIFKNNSSSQQHKLRHGNEYSCKDYVSDDVSDKVSDKVPETTTGFESDKKPYNNPAPTIWKCTLCNFICAYQSYLTRHQTVHSGSYPFDCTLCYRAFKTLNNLRWHKKTTHSNERPYPCDTCDKTFKTIAHLKQHKITHSNARTSKRTSYPNKV